jgi:uncharacterized repeat protein (TIGR03847 family)
MAKPEIELNPADFVTVGTVGPKGRRLFHLQAGHGNQIVTLIIEKEQARALAEAIREILKDLNERFPEAAPATGSSKIDMSLRDPIEPLFRIAQMGLGYDEDSNLVLLVAQELVVAEEEEEPESEEIVEPQVVRIWATREQMLALSDHAETVVKKGRADPKSNGHLIYYWT